MLGDANVSHSCYGTANYICVALGGGVDVVINNAGTTGTDGFNKWDLESVTADEMLHVFKINTVGPMVVTQQLLKHGLMGGGPLIGGGATGGAVGGGGAALVANVTSKVGSVADNGSGGGYAYRAGWRGAG